VWVETDAVGKVGRLPTAGLTDPVFTGLADDALATAWALISPKPNVETTIMAVAATT
jgi:hypothetical protein